MKKYLLVFLASAFQLAAIAQNDGEKTPFMTKTLSSESIKDVHVETSGGSISVAGGTAAEARVEVYIYSSNSKDKLTKEDIQARLDDLYDLTVSVSNNTLTATAKTKKDIHDWKKALNISFRVYVTKDVSTDLSTSGGSISISNLAGKEKFSTSGGSLNVDKVSGAIDGRTSGGSINVKDSKDDIDLSTSGGGIDAKNCEGNIRLSTSGGPLELSHLNGQIKAMTSGGSIHGDDIAGELDSHTSGGSIHLSDLTCSLETSTSGGSIDVAIKELGKYIKISNSAGNVDLTLPKNKGLDLDLNGRIADTHFDNFNGKINENEVSGKLNGGGIPVKVDAGSGKIYLSLK